MKNKTKRLIYKISVVVLIACTIFMVLVGTCFGASLTYPPDYVAATFDKSSWYNPDVTIQGVDCYKPQYYLDDISIDSTLIGYDDVAGGSYSPTQLSLGSPFYRYIPKVVFASDIRSTLNYNGDIDFINSSEQWIEGEFPLFYYNTFYRYYYGAPYGNTLISGFSASDLSDTGDYCSFTMSDLVINMTNTVDYINNSVPTINVTLMNSVGNAFDYNVRLYLEYEKVSPTYIDDEVYFIREPGYFSTVFNYDVDEGLYDYTYSFNLLDDCYTILRNILNRDVTIVLYGEEVPSNYLYVKECILEIYDEYGSSFSEFDIYGVEYQNEWLTDDNYFRNTLGDYQSHIGTTREVVIEYDYGLDFSDFISSVTSIFDIELFAGFTLLDILTGVVGVFILVWFLKVFAGG